MKIRTVFSALLLAVVMYGIPDNVNAMHSHSAEECNRITKAEVFYNASGWFLKIQIQIKNRKNALDMVISLREKPVDIRIGYELIGETENELKKVACLLEQYPQEYKNGAGLIIFVPNSYGKKAWEEILMEAELSYLRMGKQYNAPVFPDYIIPRPPEYIPDK